MARHLKRPDLIGALVAGAGSRASAFEMVRWRGQAAVSETWTRDDLLAAARRAAGAIAADTVPGDRVVIACPPGLDFVAAFFGCLGAGRIAIPAQTPASARARATVARIVAATGAAKVVTEALNCAPADLVAPTADAVAYLQFTSGSTQAPRGAVITHGALAANLAAIGDAWALGPHDRGVFWLPPHHDMGLVGALLTPVAYGFPATLMHPAAFLQRPSRWLDLISARRATFSGAPNFAYDLCADHSGDGAFDLSCWQVAVNGAEPIAETTLKRFARTFAPYGFRASAFAPGYGLAESVLFVTARRSDGPPWMACNGVVSCGPPAPGVSVRIVDDSSGAALPEGETGAIWVTGPTLAAGYWNAPVESAATFSAKVTGDPRRWLRTGDIGFLRDGALHVCGRAKDVIIRAGRKAHAADIEHAIAAVLGSPRRTAVFATDDERLIVVHEAAAHADPRATRDAIVDALGAGFDLMADEIVLAPPGAVRVTTSGKIARAATRAAWSAGDLAPAPPR